MADNNMFKEVNDNCESNMLEEQLGEIESLSPTNNKFIEKSKQDKHEKYAKGDNCNNRVKAHKTRELEDLDKSQILPARLRSDSGRVYSTGMIIESSGQPPLRGSFGALPSVNEVESEIASELDNLTMEKPCSDSACCKNTAKIVNLITKLQQSVDEIKNTNSNQANYTASISQSLRDVEEKVDEHGEDMASLKRELKEYRFQLKLVSNVVIRQDQQIAVLNKKLNDAQQREMYPNIVITGILESTVENPLQKFNQFVAQNLQIQELIPAHRAYRLGMGPNRPLLVKLRDPLTYKPKIYAQVTKLKGQKNSQGGSFFVSDHLPDEYNETRRRANDLFSENRRKDPATKVTMSIKKGRLLINEKPYAKAVTSPKPRDILYPDDKQLDLADEIDMVKGYEQTVKSSRFISYAAAIKDHNDIQAAYTKVRMKFADATHVSCAYRIPGHESYNLQDYVDDGEFGVGRAMLNVLKDEGTSNVVVFLIRYYGGIHLGPQRFEIFRDAAKEALKALRIRIEQHKQEEIKEKKREEQRQKELGSGWAQSEPQQESWEQDKKKD